MKQRGIASRNFSKEAIAEKIVDHFKVDQIQNPSAPRTQADHI